MSSISVVSPMPPAVSGRRRVRYEWRLTPAAFERLLATLDSDREKAAVAYEQLRQRIMGLVRWWGASPAEELADQTLDRVARKLEEGAVVPVGSLGAYVRGVARMIFYEWTRASRTQVPDPVLVAAAEPKTEAVLRCLDACLDDLAEGDRRLVLRYYGDGDRVELRRALAEELGISQTALRLRTHRLRQRLEVRLRERLEQA